MHQSIATIDSPEFVNLQPLDINPGLSSCEIKVLYVGANRNGSFISKAVATEMSKTLRGAPIVGYFREDKQDFGDHGEKVTIDGDGIHFECQTKPYGFVAPDAKVWFQTFDESDEFGNEVKREYLMTTGYLWAGQFEECKIALERGTNQSMELDEKTLQGDWSENYKNGLEFFIINDATFSKLCMLGDDVEPCFEGASVTAPLVSKRFELDNKFKTTLFSMMQDLKAIVSKGGNTTMENENVQPVEVVEEQPVESTEFTVEEPVVENIQEVNTESAATETEFKKAEDDTKKEESSDEEEKPSDSEDKKEDSSSESKDSGTQDDKSADTKDDKDKEDDKKKQYSLADLETKYSALQSEYENLQKTCEELRAFKTNVENKQKDELINSFYMLSDEDKRDVIDNKAIYSLDDIEAKLSVICYRKKVSFAAAEEPATEVEEKSAPAVVFSVDGNEEPAVPGYIQALRNVRK